jgi:hypothetical protein
VVHFVLDGEKENKAEAMKELKEAFSYNKKPNPLHFYSVDTTDKNDALKTFVEQENIDIIAFITHKTNLFKSLFSNKLSKKDFFKLGLPMLAMHE